MSWYFKCLKNYAVFRGRARRKEYWFFILFDILFYLVALFLDVAIGTYDDEEEVGLLETLYILATFLPSIAVTARRLHDTNRSGWWQLFPLATALIGIIILLPIAVAESENEFGMLIFFAGLFSLSAIGSTILLLVFLCQDSTLGENRFGANPKGEGNLKKWYR